MRDVLAELKALRLYGMADAWAELVSTSELGCQSSGWLLEHLLEAEHTDRHLRSIRYQLQAARFPVHRDLAGFDFEQSKVERALIQELATLDFTAQAHNVVFIGGTGTGKSHLATALGVSGITQQGKRVRFYSTVDLVNLLEQEKAAGKAGKLAFSLLRMDLVILDELGYLPGQSHLHVITPSSSARNSSIVAASMRLDLMLALRVVLSRSRFITMWRTMAKLLAA